MSDNRFMREVAEEVIAEMEKANIELTEENFQKALKDKFDWMNAERSRNKMRIMKEQQAMNKQQ